MNDKRVIRDFFKVLVNYKHIQSFKRLMDFRNDLESRGVIGFGTVTNSRLEQFWENCNRNNWSFGNDSYFVQAVFEKDNIIGLCLDEIRISKDKDEPIVIKGNLRSLNYKMLKNAVDNLWKNVII